MDYSAIYQKQRAYYQSGATRSYEARAEALKKLQKALKQNKNALQTALQKDLNKQPMESVMTETSVVAKELKYIRKHLKKWMKDKSVSTPRHSFPGKSFVSPEPLGQVLIISPWNYPVQLCLCPLIGAIAAGNCVVLKPSVKAPESALAIKNLLLSVFPEEHVYVAEGSREETAGLLDLKWDHIFFTGSKDGGRQILAAAAKFLTPVTLELGGKSPVIVDKTAKLKLAARRIAFGKALNAGQTCVAPDYLLIHEDVKDEFLGYYAKAIKKFFPRNKLKDMVTIINDEHVMRLASYMEGADVVVGGMVDPEKRQIQPSVINAPALDSPVMTQEIFGPLLPVITWNDLGWCIDYINAQEKPLALYVFAKDKAIIKRVLEHCSFGGGCVNDTLMHTMSEEMAFGGVGESGMGSYHGRKSFDTFTHYRSILRRGTWTDPKARYFPYKGLKFMFIKSLMK